MEKNKDGSVTVQEIVEQYGISLTIHNHDKIRDFTKRFYPAEIVEKNWVRKEDEN